MNKIFSDVPDPSVMRPKKAGSFGWQANLATLLTTLLVAACGSSNGADSGNADVIEPRLASTAVTAVTFTPSEAILANPERGESGWAGDLAKSVASEIQAEVDLGYRLLRSLVLLDEHRQVDLSESFLADLRAGFSAVREAGAKVVPRFAYNSPASDFIGTAPDASLQQVLRHIDQLAPILQANADIMAHLEAGFIGNWGEWHSSSNNLTTQANKLAVRDALLSAMPVNRAVLFRYPLDIKTWYPDTQNARVGMHNDCFLSSPDDVGTYPDEQTGLREYIMQLSSTKPFGAETCYHDNSRNSCADILREGKQYHLSYLNRFGNTEGFQDNWAAQSCLAEVKTKIGYRFELQSLSHATAVDAGESFTVQIKVANRGWARLHNSRALALTLVNQASRQRVNLVGSGADASQWPATTQDIESSVAFTLPSDMSPGIYTMLLGLPDPAANLSERPHYAIRFANSIDAAQGQVWQSDTGQFQTGTAIQIR